MTIKKICDLCGAEIKKVENPILKFKEGKEEKRLDICDDCLKRILKSRAITSRLSELEEIKRRIFG